MKIYFLLKWLDQNKFLTGWGLFFIALISPLLSTLFSKRRLQLSLGIYKDDYHLKIERLNCEYNSAALVNVIQAPSTWSAPYTYFNRKNLGSFGNTNNLDKGVILAIPDIIMFKFRYNNKIKENHEINDYKSTKLFVEDGFSNIYELYMPYSYKLKENSDYDVHVGKLNYKVRKYNKYSFVILYIWLYIRIKFHNCISYLINIRE